MSSILRPTSSQMIRRLIVLGAAIAAIVIGYSQTAIGWGQTPAEFSADSDATLRVAGYAFAIWGLIYAWLLVYAVRQALPATGESKLLTRLGWPSALALAGIGLWVVAAAFDWELATIGLIFGSLLVLLVPLLANARDIRALPGRDRDRWMAVWPLAMLAGWLSIAAPVNLVTVLTGNGALPDPLSPTVWAMLAIVVVAVVAVLVTARLRLLAFALPVAWGLGGVFVAEQTRNPGLAVFAVGAAVAVLAASAVLLWRARVTR